MNRRITALTLSLLIFGTGATGCSEEAAHWTANSRALDRKMLTLQPGTSTADVRAKFGKPRLEKNLGEEEVLYYGLWQLVFSDQGLKSQTRDYKRPSRLATTYGKLGNRMVLKLQLGTSIEDVRAKFGTPLALEIFRNLPHKEESLWYGNGQWELGFTDGKLTSRNKY